MKTMDRICKLVLPTPFRVGTVNAYLILGETVTLIDAGTKTQACWESFLQQLDHLGVSFRDIDQIVLTHHHIDHCGLLDYLADKKDIPVYSHPLAVPWIVQDSGYLRQHREFFREFYPKMGVPLECLRHVDNYDKMIIEYTCRIGHANILREGDHIPGMGDWMVYETPGHAQSHLAFYREADQVLLGGDHLIKHITSNAILEAPHPKTSKRAKTLLQYRESLLKCKELNISTVYSGHGDEIYNASELIEQRLIEQDQRAGKIKSWISDQALTPFEISERLFPHAFQEQLPLTMSEVVGHLDLLVEREEVIVESTDGVGKYQAI